MHSFYDIGLAAWALLEQSSLFILLGLAVAGLLKIFLSPDYVATHLGRGIIKPVFKAALLGVPIPLCSCGVLPAVAQLRKQGANKGAATAFLIATPESGVDSIAVSWVLLDPLMTVARPIAAFLSACIAGTLENVLVWRTQSRQPFPFLPVAERAPVSCSDKGCGCSHDHRAVSVWETCEQGLRYAATDLWGDLAGWFFMGIVIAACITVLIPDDLIHNVLGGGLGTMLLMLVAGIPMYVCATAATPIAAALILKGVSPGAVLVFLLVGPATNAAAIAVLVRILGKRGLAVYLISISVVSVLCGLVLDGIYASLGISAAAHIGEVAEVLPGWLMLAATGLLLLMSLLILVRRFSGKVPECC